MKLYVIRHGQTEMNVKGLINGSIDEPLTETGIQQATEARKLVPDTIKKVYSSSLHRARQTAEILTQNLSLPVVYTDDLQEVDFGELNGTPFIEEVKVKHQLMEYDWRPTGESVDDVKKRVLRILTTIAEENPGEEILIVAHGGIIRMFHYLEYGEPLGLIENASLHEFDLDKILS